MEAKRSLTKVHSFWNNRDCGTHFGLGGLIIKTEQALVGTGALNATVTKETV
jgi:hypothetical protein